jgi:hypothetical protein
MESTSSNCWLNLDISKRPNLRPVTCSIVTGTDYQTVSENQFYLSKGTLTDEEGSEELQITTPGQRIALRN